MTLCCKHIKASKMESEISSCWRSFYLDIQSAETNRATLFHTHYKSCGKPRYGNMLHMCFDMYLWNSFKKITDENWQEMNLSQK